MIAAVLTGWLAMITGLIDLLNISKQKNPAVGSAFIHGLINGSLILVYTVLAYKGWKTYPLIGVPTMSILLVKSILVVALFVGNFLGGRLIYTYHVGINKDNE